MKNTDLPSELQDFMFPEFDRGQQGLPQNRQRLPRLVLRHHHEALKRMKNADLPSALQDFMFPGLDRGQQARGVR